MRSVYLKLLETAAVQLHENFNLVDLLRGECWKLLINFLFFSFLNHSPFSLYILLSKRSYYCVLTFLFLSFNALLLCLSLALLLCLPLALLLYLKFIIAGLILLVLSDRILKVYVILILFESLGLLLPGLLLLLLLCLDSWHG